MADETKIVGLKVGVDTGNSANEVKKLENASGDLLSGLNKLSDGTGIASKAIGALAAGLAALELVRYIEDATLLAARVETLGVVMHAVGVNAGYTSREMDGFAKSIAAQGITTEASRQAAIRLSQAHVDLTKSTELARIAQDAAVIAQTNSSDAFDRMTTGIATGQAIILHHMGLMVNFEHGYKELGETLGKTSDELTESEKTQARVNEVMKAGAGIAGSYEAAMTTAGKQLTSLTRYFDEIKLAVGEPFTETFSLVLQDVNHNLKGLLSTMKDNKENMVGFGHDVADAYRFLKNEANQLASALDMLGGEATRVAAIGMKSAELLTRFVTIGQFGDGLNSRYEGLRQINKIYEERFKLHQNEIAAYNAASGVSGPALDPKESMMLRMAKERDELKRIAKKKPEDNSGTETITDASDQLWNSYLSGLKGFNDQIRQLNPDLTDFQKKSQAIDDTLAQQLEKFKGFENNPGVQRYVESLKTAAAHAKQNLTLDYNLQGNEMTPRQQYQFDEAARLSKWKASQADSDRKEEQDQFNHLQTMAGIESGIDQQRLQHKAEYQSGIWGIQTAGFAEETAILESKYQTERQKAEEQLIWTLSNTALEESEKERIKEEYRARERAANNKLVEDKLTIEQRHQRVVQNLQASAVNYGIGLLQTLANHNKAAAIASIAVQKGFAIAQTFVSTKAAEMRAMAELGPIAGPPVAASIEAWGDINMALIAATGIADMVSATGRTGGAGGTGGGTNSSPVVTQPRVETQQQQIQIVIHGAIGEKRWFEDNLPPILQDFASRNVSTGVVYA